MNLSFSDPEQNIKKAGILDGMRIADFGCGTGAYPLALGRVFSQSKVYAIDVQKSLLEHLENEAKINRINNIQTVWADFEKKGGSLLRAESVDWVIIANTLFLSENKEEIFKEAYRVLLPKGQILIVEWSDSFSGMGPSVEQVVSPDEVKKILLNSHFVISNSFDAGSHHYALVAHK